MEKETLFRQVVNALCNGAYSNAEMATMFDAKRDSIGVYTCNLKRYGLATMDPVKKQYHIPAIMHAEAKAIANKVGGSEWLKDATNRLRSEKKEMFYNNHHEENPAITEFAEYISHLNWLLSEYIPHLESENDKAQRHANDLMRQMNMFIGTMKQAKIIHNRFVERIDEPAP